MVPARVIIFALVASLSVTALPASGLDLPSRFEALDRNGDDGISFDEFTHYTDSLELTRTLAAQHFVRLSAGDAVISAQEFFLATQVRESESWQKGYALEPISAELTPVEPVDIRAFEAIPDDRIDATSPQLSAIIARTQPTEEDSR